VRVVVITTSNEFASEGKIVAENSNVTLINDGELSEVLRQT
jgi:hypothetical protein